MGTVSMRVCCSLFLCLLPLVGVSIDALCGRGFVGVIEFFFMPALRLVSFLMCSGLLVGLSIICGHVRRPPIGGSASSKVMMSGKFSPSTTALAALSAVLLYSTSVCDFTFPICVLSCLWSLSFSSWFMSCRRSLCRCWLWAAGSIV